MKNKREVNVVKLVENMMVILVMFTIIIILAKPLGELVAQNLKTSAETSTRGTIEMVKELYTTINITDEVNLPFKVVYKNDGYTIYSNNEVYTPTMTLNLQDKDKLPTEGSVTVEKDGTIVVKNLKFGLYKCNQNSEGADNELVCKI